MKLNLNLATTPLQNNRRFIAGAGLAGIAALFALVILTHQTYSTWRANSAIRRCAVYTRKSSEEGLEQDFKFLDVGPATIGLLLRNADLRKAETAKGLILRGCPRRSAKAGGG